MTKRELRKEMEYAYTCNARLIDENDMLREKNRFLEAEVEFLQDNIDLAVRYCERKLCRKDNVPTWLKEVMADG